MPQVPVYGDRQVRTEALRPVFQNTPDVSSGGRALAQGLGQVAEAADRVVMRDAQDEAFKVEQQVRKDWANQRGALRDQYKGDNADQYKAKADEWWSKARETYGAQINPMARSLAGKSLEQYRVAAEADTVGYVQSEKTKAREINFRTLQDTIIIEAGQTITPENARVLSAATAKTIEKNAIDYAAGEGYSSDVGKKMAREQLDKFHSEAAASLADKDAIAARAYLNEFGKDIPLGLRTGIDAAVTKNYNDQEGKRLAQSLAGLQTLAEKEEALAKIDNAELREAATTHVYRDQTRLIAVKTEATKALHGNAKLSYEKTGRVPPSIMAALEAADPGVAADLMRGIKADQKARRIEAQGDTVKTDFAAWQQAYSQIAAGKPVDLLLYREKVSMADLKSLEQMKGKGSGGTQDSMLTDQDRMLKSKPATLDPKTNPEGYGRYVYEIDRRVRQASTDAGNKPLTATEKQKIIDDVAKDTVFVSEFGRDPQKPLVLLQPDELKNAYVTVNGQEVKLSTIPMNDRQQIIDSLRRKGESISEQAIAEVYLRRKPQSAPRPVTPAPGAATTQPSIYASAEEWAAYRAAQAQKPAK